MEVYFKKLNLAFPIHLDKFQTIRKKNGVFLKEHFPQAANEIWGITDTTGTDNRIFLSKGVVTGGQHF